MSDRPPPPYAPRPPQRPTFIVKELGEEEGRAFEVLVTEATARQLGDLIETKTRDITEAFAGAFAEVFALQFIAQAGGSLERHHANAAKTKRDVKRLPFWKIVLLFAMLLIVSFSFAYGMNYVFSVLEGGVGLPPDVTFLFVPFKRSPYPPFEPSDHVGLVLFLVLMCCFGAFTCYLLVIRALARWIAGDDVLPRWWV